jgi:outer membrane protein assembly factor BamB
MQCNRSFANASPALRFIPFRASSAMQRSFTLTLLLLLLTACLFCSTVATAEETLATAPAVTITPTVGPPTTNVLVWGTGFDPYVAVDIYFDTTDLALATTNGQGTFGGGSIRGGIAIQVPASAVPGTHWVTAVERYGQKAAQKSFLVRTDWAQFRFEPRHRGMNPYENVLSPATVGSMDLHWNYRIGAQSLSSPAVANGVVYVGSDDGYLYALNASTGALLWKYTTDNVLRSSPAVANGVVYVGDLDGFLYALNASTGALLWKYNTGEVIQLSSPAVADGVVYIGAFNPDSNLYALNASTGALLWVYRMRADEIESSPAVANGVVYVGSSSYDCYGRCNLYALNASTGALLWSYTTAGPIWSSPAVANGVVYVGDLGGFLYALNASTGALLWVYTTATGAIFSSPAVANSVVYVGSDSLYALNAGSGALLWKYGMGIYSSPAVANGVVYIGSEDLYALNASTGVLLWTYTIGSGITSPAVANGVEYVSSSDGKLYAFDLTGGLLSKKFSPPERPNPSLLVPNWKLKPSTPVTRMPSDSQE